MGIASEDHVKAGVAGGFAQLGHGKQAPIQTLSAGDPRCAITFQLRQ